MEENLQSKNKKIIIAVIAIITAIIIYYLASNVSCGGASNKIEVLTETVMSKVLVYNEYKPVVKAQVRNKSNGTIKVQLKCSVYGSDGSVTQNITSLIMELAAGESTWLTAEEYTTYSVLAYSSKCASFGNVEYRLY